jgi:hypothetical protein
MSLVDDCPKFVREALEGDEEAIGPATELLVRYGRSLLREPSAIDGGEERLAVALSHPGLRRAPFFDRVGALFGLSDEQLRALFVELENPARWAATPFSGVEVARVPSETFRPPVECWILRLYQGACCPQHEHPDVERSLVLSGACEEVGRGIHRAGAAMVMAPGSRHSLVGLSLEPCLLAVRSEKPARFLARA